MARPKKAATKKATAKRRGRPPKTASVPQPAEEQKPLSAPDVLKAAAKHTADRKATYDKSGPEGERSMAKTVEVFNAYYGLGLTEAQGWHFQSILKKVRQLNSKDFHQDSAEDRVAYVALEAEAHAKEGK